MLNPSTPELARHTLNTLADQIYYANVKAGWYRDPHTGRKIKRNVMEMLMLVVTELSEAAEGWRRDLADDHLQHRTMFEVEIADTLIRLFDLIGYIRNNPEQFAGYDKVDLGSSFVEKLLYNGERADHKLSNRALENGKKC